MFQNSILKKYLAQLPAASVRAAWERFTAFFHDPEMQRQIRGSKEEEFQDGFLRELFVNVLGYTMKPYPNFNLVREQKNITNARSADGAILKDQKVFAVIELKDTNTRDLTRVEDQAFGYKNAHPGVNYVVISNFEELRFYIDSTVNHVDFNLFTMTESDFRLLYFCLAAESLLKDAPLHAQKDSVVNEGEITEKLYGDYSRFKRALFDDLCRRNADRGLDRLLLFRKTQKLLDRLVFIFFCEDRGLLPPNSIAKIITSWREQTIWNPRPLYEQFRAFFGFVNAGQPQLGIFAYNGGLFAPDELLDSLKIDDELLAEHTQKLSAYDFESEVDVNILGHIFEHSLTEIEEIKNTGTTLPASLKNTETTLPASLKNTGTTLPASSLETQDLNSTDDAGSVVPVIVPVRYHDRYFNPDMPIDKTQGNLPHWDQTEKLQFVTFRLADSLPQERVREWSDERERWLAAHPKPWDEETEKQYYQDFEQKIDKWLDKGYGSCVLSSPDLRKIVADAILFFDNQRYIVESFVIMPNHVHVLLEVINGYELGEILHSWKSFTANKINKVLNLTGPFWQKESYDTIIRGLKHFQYVSGYIKANADCVPEDKVTYYYRYGQKYGDDASSVVKKYGDDASSVVKKTKFSDDAGSVVPANSPNDAGSVVPVNKRKRDGVFYTPPYITRFIVENTLGALCSRKKTALGIADETYAASETFTPAVRKKLEETLFSYRDWLLDLKICDPACGSGAFLVAALNFLLEEHRRIDAWYARLHYGKDGALGQSTLVLTDLDQSILERNLYGVDINEESVEIARLSLWLHTCKRGRKLNSLTQNIKCGNSLLDDQFNWEAEFPFGGFDVVIGNPPYVQLQTMGAMSDVYAAAGYQSFNKSADLYCLFTERGYDLLRPGGIQSFIMPNKWMITSYGKPLRRFMAGTGLQQVLNFGDVQFFADATIYCCIFVTEKAPKPETVRVLSVNQKTYTNFDAAVAQRYEYPASEFGEDEWSIQPLEDFRTLQKMKEVGTPLKALPVTIYRGILTGFNDAFFIDTATKERLIQEDPRSAELIRPLLRGRDIVPYGAEWDDLWLIGTFPSLHLNIEDFPAIQNHLLSFGKARLAQTGEKGSRKKTSNQWFETQDSISYYEDFAKPKIIYPNMTSVFPFMLDSSGFVSNDKSFIMVANDDSVSLPFLTAVFNSSPAKLWIWYNCPELMGGTREIRKVYFENFPVPPADAAQTAALASLAEQRTAKTAELQKLRHDFTRLVVTNFPGVKLTSVLSGLETLDFPTFLKELNRQKRRPSLQQQNEWADYIEEQTAAARALTAQIALLDAEVDKEVKALYGI